MEDNNKLVAPNVDNLLRFFEHGHRNPSTTTPALTAAMEPLFDLLKPLAPLKSNDEAKAIWLRIPRGTIEDYDSFEDMKDWGEVDTYEEYEKRWLQDYPDELVWYRLVIVEGFERDGSLRFRGVSLGGNTIVSATMNAADDRIDPFDRPNAYSIDAAVQLCSLILPAVRETLNLLIAGTYNKMVESALPYQFRTGIIKRSDVWKYEHEDRVHSRDGLSDEVVEKYRVLIGSGVNDEAEIGRIQQFTANDFFNACCIGYRACGYDLAGLSSSDAYLRFADGRDEGLTGTGHGLNEGPGINFDSPSEWDEWYHASRGGGHPWEVIRGGNSTHVDLYVGSDRKELGYLRRAGKITEEEYTDRMTRAGYYFHVAGKHRPFEAVSFYVALSEAGLPVIISDAEEILARFDGTDYIGIVPHATIPKYCEGMFPDKYGRVIDFVHVYSEELEKYGADIIWLPEDPAELKTMADDVGK